MGNSYSSFYIGRPQQGRPYATSLQSFGYDNVVHQFETRLKVEAHTIASAVSA